MDDSLRIKILWICHLRDNKPKDCHEITDVVDNSIHWCWYIDHETDIDGEWITYCQLLGDRIDSDNPPCTEYDFNKELLEIL